MCSVVMFDVQLLKIKDQEALEKEKRYKNELQAFQTEYVQSRFTSVHRA